MYGAGKPTFPITVDRKALSDAFRNGAGENAIFLLKLAGSDQSRHAMIKEFQRDPLSRKAMHIDFVRVLMDAKIRVSRFRSRSVGAAVGVKVRGRDPGLRDPARSRSSPCPANIPAHLPIDVSALEIGDAIRVSQISAHRGGRDRGRPRQGSRPRRPPDPGGPSPWRQPSPRPK